MPMLPGAHKEGRRIPREVRVGEQEMETARMNGGGREKMIHLPKSSGKTPHKEFAVVLHGYSSSSACQGRRVAE